MNNLIRPALYGAFHNILPVNLTDNKTYKYYDIVGPIYETGDILEKILERSLRRMTLLCSTGAYSSCMASEYNLRGKVNELFIKKQKIKVSTNKNGKYFFLRPYFNNFKKNRYKNIKF